MDSQKVKVSFKVITSIHDELAEHLKLVSLKRDAFLNLVLKTEIAHLEADIDGLILSSRLKKNYSAALNAQKTKIINVVLDEDVAKKMNTLIEQTNIHRDSFINRVIYYLVCRDKLIHDLGLPTNIPLDLLKMLSSGALPFKPLNFITTTLYDPLFFLRAYMANEGKSLYKDRNDLPLCLTCYEEELNISIDEL